MAISGNLPLLLLGTVLLLFIVPKASAKDTIKCMSEAGNNAQKLINCLNQYANQLLSKRQSDLRGCIAKAGNNVGKLKKCAVPYNSVANLTASITLIVLAITGGVVVGY